MTRVLVLASDGMLGAAVDNAARVAFGDSVWCTRRRGSKKSDPTVVEIDDLTDTDARQQLLDTIRPTVVLNCAGVLMGGPPDRLVEVNSQLPRWLASECSARGARVVHVSTDAVFSGLHGPNDERTPPDPVDDYGRSKLAGELDLPHLTVRTSIIGRRTDGQGLVEWAIAHRGTTVQGYGRSLWSGVTAPELARLLVDHVQSGSTAGGIVHVRSDFVSKAELIRRIDRAFALGLTVDEVAEPVVDRRLVSRRSDVTLEAPTR